MGILRWLLFKKKSTPSYPCDELVINGEKLKLTFFAHASLADRKSVV